MTSSCIHLYIVDKGISNNINISKQEGICSWCRIPGPNLWLCLYKGCFKIGCGESGANHSSCHNHEIPSHCIAINLSNLKAWCYMCEIEVTHWVLSKMNLSPSIHLGNQINSSGVAIARPITPNDSSAEEEEDEGRYLSEQEIKPKGLVGLRNLGLTCYMNAALQALSNSVPLACFMKDCSAFLKVEKKQQSTTIIQPFHRLIEDIWHARRPSCLAPTVIFTSFRTLYPMFRLYTQQDSQEFLRYFMDQLHEELKQPYRPLRDSATEEESESSTSEEGEDNELSSLGNVSDEQQQGSSDDSLISSSNSELEDYETCDSGLSDQSFSSPIPPRKKRRRSLHNKLSKYGLEQKECLGEFSDAMSDTSLLDVKNSTSYRQNPSYSTSGIGSSKPSLFSLQSRISNSSMQSKSSNRRKKSLKGNAGNATTTTSVPKSPGPCKKKKQQTKYRSIISDCFDGLLVSSVQCLTCNTTSSKKETFQDLSLPIPSSDQLCLLQQHPTVSSPLCSSNSLQSNKNSTFNIYLNKNTCDASTNGWMWIWVWSVWGWMKSWLWGPRVSLFNCLAAFFSADELKGDNMYSCEKCGKLRNGIKYSKVVQLPEVLIIHLKRFRHEYMFSSKIGQYVSFPLYGLDLSPFLHKDCKSQVKTYDLYSVICHHGAVGSGHYTAYAQNSDNQRWYEFDDQCVTEVSVDTVANCEAYVLFYKKSNNEIGERRQRTLELMQVSSHEPSLMQFYVSKQWINKFNTFAEPGPIDNSDFLCVHGGVQPLKATLVEDMVMIFSQGVWEYLHQVFGGGPACTSLFECVTCKEEQEALVLRQKTEFDTFIRLHSLFQEEEQPSIVFVISMKWFRLWEAFVRDRQQEPPGPLDNSSICVNKHSHPSQGGPRAGSDYAPISKELWSFFYDIYSGGPEIYIRYGALQEEIEKLERTCSSRRQSYTSTGNTSSSEQSTMTTRQNSSHSSSFYGLKSLSTEDIPYSVTFNPCNRTAMHKRTFSTSELEMIGRQTQRLIQTKLVSSADEMEFPSEDPQRSNVIRYSDVQEDEEDQAEVRINEIEMKINENEVRINEKEGRINENKVKDTEEDLQKISPENSPRVVAEVNENKSEESSRSENFKEKKLNKNQRRRRNKK